MLVDGTTHKILLKITDSGNKGITSIELMDHIQGTDSMVYKATCKLKHQGKIKKNNDRWFLNPDGEFKEPPSQREVVLNCLLAFHNKSEPCSIWDLITMSGLTRERISTMMYRVRLKHEVIVEGSGDERIYTYVGLKGQKPKEKKNPEEKPKNSLTDRYNNDNSIERCYLLLQALDTLDIDKVATCFGISKCEAGKLIKGVIQEYDYTIDNITITYKK